MGQNRRERLFVAVVLALVVGGASPAAGAETGPQIGDALAAGDSALDNASGTVEETAGTTDDRSGASESEPGDEDAGHAGASAAVSLGVDDGTVDADATATSGTNGTVDAAVSVGPTDGVNASAGADADRSLDATANLSGDGSDVAANATLSASAGDSGLDADIAVSNGTADLAVTTRLEPTAPSLSVVGNGSTAAGDVTSGTDSAADPRSDPGAQPSERRDADGTDTAGGDDATSAGDDESAPAIPAGVPAVVLGGTLVGVTVAARSGLTVVGVGSTSVSGGVPVRAAVRGLLADLPDLIVPVGYSRHDDSDPLDHDRRAGLYERITASPGVHLSGLAAETDASLSSVRHHLRVLVYEGLVETERIRGRRRLFPAETDHTALTAALEDPATAAVLRALADAEPASVSTLADRLDRDPSTVSHHLSRLAEDGVVERERDGRTVETRLSSPARRLLADPATGAGAAAD